MATKQKSRTSAQSALWLIGVVLFVQGFGSAVTEAFWGTSFGVAGLLRAASLPGWTDLVVGGLGAGFLITAIVRSRAGRRPGK
jgi:hypothetical protein